MFKKEIILGILCLFAACHSNDEIIEEQESPKNEQQEPKARVDIILSHEEQAMSESTNDFAFQLFKQVCVSEIEKQIYSYHLSVYLFVFLCQQMEQMETRLLK